MRNQHRLISVVVLLLIVFVSGEVWSTAAGKIMGRVFEKKTNAPLFGANIMVEGTNRGAASDKEGYFVILNVQPGNYSVRTQMMGYATQIQENVKVSVNLTTTLNIAMEEEIVQGQTVTVVAERPVVRLDVSSSQKIIDATAIEDRPVDNLEEILSTETGITLSASTDGTGLIVRGGGLNETDIIVDGLSTRNERTQQPVTTLNLTAIQEVEILTGGFNAEYGDIRSGMVSIVTREGSLDRYSMNLDTRMSPPARKHFGPSPFSIDGPFWPVYTGADAFTGIDEAMVETGNYPFTFIGWNEVARQFLSDNDPNNDMTPQELMEVWKWQHRIRTYADKPDYILDGSFSGKIPLLPVAFMLSQRYEDLQLIYPFSRNNSVASTTLLKLTTQVGDNMKLSFNNTYILMNGVSGSIYDDTNGMISGSREGVEYGRDAFYWRYIWHNANYNPIETRQYRGGISLNHVVSTRTFYDVRLEYTHFQTVQEPVGLRNTTGIKQIGNNWYDEAPWGYMGSEIGSIIEKYDILGDFLMSGGGRGQDHSRYWGLGLTANMISQMNSHNEIKAGFNIDYMSFEERREINHSRTTQSVEEAPWYWWYYDESPIKAGAYVQDKMEYGGMIANVGVRLDYLKAGTSPYNIDPQFIFQNLPYTLTNYRALGNSFSGLTTDGKDYKVHISPRLGISHPVTATSKIFFNYGHFFQPPVNDQLYEVKPYSRSAVVPNVGVEWPRTIAYEIGFEQSVGPDILIHFMGYYKDVSDQLSQQDIVAIDEENQVTTWANNSYADIRGLELKLERRVGKWWYGWISTEYMARSTGFTGLRYIYEDRQKDKQQRENTNQIKPQPIPSLMANLTFRTPENFGPRVLGQRPLGDWRLNILQEWSDGGKELLNPDALLSEQRYVDVIDWWNTDLLLEKRFQIGAARLGFFMQVKNLLNFHGFPSPLYWNKYVDSLHFPYETGAQKGNDKLGDWNKDYIDLGWNTWQHFINPRDIFFGLRFQF